MDGFYDASTEEKYNRVLEKLFNNGYQWVCDNPRLKRDYTFDDCKRRIHGNAKLVLHAFYNDITRKKEIQFGTRAIYKTYPMYRNLKVMEI